MLLRAALILAFATAVPVVAAPSTAHADGVERPRVERPAPRPRARPAPRPAPVQPRAEAPPAPQIIERIIEREPDMRLSDGFFYGPLTGGVGFQMDHGAGLGGGSVIVNGGGSHAAGFSGAIRSGGKGGGFAVGGGRCG
jgi:hypothetical protein